MQIRKPMCRVHLWLLLIGLGSTLSQVACAGAARKKASSKQPWQIPQTREQCHTMMQKDFLTIYRLRGSPPIRFAAEEFWDGCGPKALCGGFPFQFNISVEDAIREASKYIDEFPFYIHYVDKHMDGRDYGDKGIRPFVPYSRFKQDPAKAARLLARIQKVIDTAHKYGMRVHLDFIARAAGVTRDRQVHSISYPGAQPYDFAQHPEYNAEILNHKTGKFVRLGNYLDWANPRAVRHCLDALGYVLKKLKGEDYLICCEEDLCWFRGDKAWYKSPTFSQAALDNYRAYLKKPEARFPTTPDVPNTTRTFNTPTRDDWLRWFKWREQVRIDFIHARARAAREANRDDPPYKGDN